MRKGLIGLALFLTTGFVTGAEEEIKSSRDLTYAK